jgi:hypothetical protein
VRAKGICGYFLSETKYLLAEITFVTKFISKMKYTLYPPTPVNTAILEVTELNSVKTPKRLGYM